MSTPVEQVHASAPLLARPRAFGARLLRDARRALPLTRALARRDLRLQYRHPLTGSLAVVLPPLAMTGMGMGFRAAGVIAVSDTAIPYSLFVLTGLTLWFTLLEALNAPVHGLLKEQRLLTRTDAPPEAVVMAGLVIVGVNLALRLVPLVGLAVFHGIDTNVLAVLVLAPMAVLTLVGLGTAAGLLIAPLNLLYSDFSRLVMIATMLWLFLSPVYYPVPDAGGLLAAVMHLNPVTPLLAAARTALLTGDAPGAAASLGGGSLPLAALLLAALAWVGLRVVLPLALERGSA